MKTFATILVVIALIFGLIRLLRRDQFNMTEQELDARLDALKR